MKYLSHITLTWKTKCFVILFLLFVFMATLAPLWSQGSLGQGVDEKIVLTE